MRLPTLIFLVLSALGLTVARAASLPDTGQTLCDNGSNVNAACTSANTGDAAVYPRQDGRFGHDAQATAATPGSVKAGAGAAGFDYTKVANNGTDVAAGTALGTGPTDWACTRDNITGLTWEVKTTTPTDLRYSGHWYTWYSTNGATNAGGQGNNSITTGCGTPATLPSCNTESFVAAVNAAALCGFTDWRLPSRRELRTIVHIGASTPSIDTTYFPNTATSTAWWTSSSSSSSLGWAVFFGDGNAVPLGKSNSSYVRVVRGATF